MPHYRLGGSSAPLRPLARLLLSLFCSDPSISNLADILEAKHVPSPRSSDNGRWWRLCWTHTLRQTHTPLLLRIHVHEHSSSHIFLQRAKNKLDPKKCISAQALDKSRSSSYCEGSPESSPTLWKVVGSIPDQRPFCVGFPCSFFVCRFSLGSPPSQPPLPLKACEVAGNGCLRHVKGASSSLLWSFLFKTNLKYQKS